MLILGIETSGILCSVAWMNEGRILLEYNIEMPNVHATLLADLISDGSKKLQIKNRDIHLVAVALGPGSFTGLRIGMSYAKGFCYGLKIPIIGVTNFDILVRQAPVNADQVYTLINAGHDKYYLGFFKDGINLTSAELITSDQILKKMNKKCIIVINDGTGGDIKGIAQSFPYSIEARYSAGLLCKIAENKLKNKGADDLDKLEPFYLQPFAGVK